MKTTALRKISFFLTLLMLANPILSSCSDAGTNDSAPTSGEVSSEVEMISEETEPETEEVLTDNVPELDFGGETVTIAGQKSDGCSDISSEEITGEVLNDAIFNRNAAMEERFNVSFAEPLATDYGTVSAAVKATVQAGDAAYDIILNQLAQTSSDALNGNYMNLSEIPYLDFTQRWYPASVIESASLNNKLYLMVSDLCISYVGQTWSMCFNKDLATDMGIENLYDLVREGEWTLDKLMEITSEIYIDINGDGVRDEGDRYGFTMGSNGIDGCKGAALLYGAGQTVDLIDKQDVAGIQIGQQSGQIAGLFNGGAGGDPDAHAHLVGDDAGQGGFAQTGRAVEQGVVQRLVAPPGGLQIHGEVGLGLLLAGVVGQKLGAQAHLGGIGGHLPGRDQGSSI